MTSPIIMRLLQICQLISLSNNYRILEFNTMLTAFFLIRAVPFKCN